MEATIAVTGLRKRFGPTQALDGLTFTVTPGQITGFVGPNGAGKSTTMRVILGLDAPDAGTALIGGHGYRTLRYPLSHVGALLDAAALQPSRTARNHLLWLAHLYFALIALLSLGVATAVRDSATAVGVVLALLFLFPIVASVVTDPHWQRHLLQIAPMTAGLAIQSTTGLRSLPIGPWAGLGVLAAWATGSLLTGGLLLRLRDA